MPLTRARTRATAWSPSSAVTYACAGNSEALQHRAGRDDDGARTMLAGIRSDEHGVVVVQKAARRLGQRGAPQVGDFHHERGSDVGTRALEGTLERVDVRDEPSEQ